MKKQETSLEEKQVAKDTKTSPAAKKVSVKPKKETAVSKVAVKSVVKSAPKSKTSKTAAPSPEKTDKSSEANIQFKTAKEDIENLGKKANELFSALLLRVGADKDKIFNTLKEEGTQVISDMIAEAIVDPKFKNFSDIKSSDIKTLLKKHTMQKLFNAGRSALTDTIASGVKSKMGEKMNTKTSSLKIDEKTNFVEFIHYMIDNPLYKGSNASSAVVAFIASQSTVDDIVLGNAAKWEKVVAQVKMFENSSLDKAATHKLNVQLVENFFGTDIANSFDEHFSSAAAPKAQSGKKVSP